MDSIKMSEARRVLSDNRISSLRSGSVECESCGISESCSGLKRIGPNFHEDSRMVLSSWKGVELFSTKNIVYFYGKIITGVIAIPKFLTFSPVLVV